MQPDDLRSRETCEALLAIVAAFVRSDELTEWSLAELERRLHPVPPLTVSDAVAELAMHGVVTVSGETVSVSPASCRAFGWC
jgi:hypothetical protein